MVDCKTQQHICIFYIAFPKQICYNQNNGEREDIHLNKNIFFENQDLYAHHTVDESPDPGCFYMHIHGFPEIYCFLQGDAHYIVEGSSYSLRYGDILIMKPGESHRLKLDSHAKYERISIHFDPNILAGTDSAGLLTEAFNNRRTGRGNKFSSSDFRDESYLMYIRKAIQAESDPQIKQMAVFSNLVSFLIELRYAFCNRIENATEKFEDPTVVKMIGYVNQHLYDDISLSDVSRKFYISQAYANRIFREATGATVWNYIMMKRLHKARAAIRNGRLLSDIYSECGYQDYSSFFRAYKKYFGCSPSDDKPQKVN